MPAPLRRGSGAFTLGHDSSSGGFFRSIGRDAMLRLRYNIVAMSFHWTVPKMLRMHLSWGVV
jgi:hypothetical protein